MKIWLSERLVWTARLFYFFIDRGFMVSQARGRSAVPRQQADPE